MKRVPMKEILAALCGGDSEIEFWFQEVVLWIDVNYYREGNWVVREGLIVEVVGVGDV